jgi:hypothetical protein
MPSVGFEPVILEIKQLQTYALGCMATEFSKKPFYPN